MSGMSEIVQSAMLTRNDTDLAAKYVELKFDIFWTM
jgi:hypothetical protein